MQRVAHLRERHAGALDLLAVDVHHELGIAGREGGEERAQLRRLVAGANQLAARLGELLDLAARLVEQLELETAERAETADGGGRKGTTTAPLIAPSSPRSLATMVCAECSSPGRSSIDFSRVKIMPRFGDAPPKLKPTTEKALCTSGTFASTASTCRMTAEVYSSDAPSGPCTWMMMKF
jgi:hypothetical protein